MKPLGFLFCTGAIQQISLLFSRRIHVLDVVSLILKRERTTTNRPFPGSFLQWIVYSTIQIHRRFHCWMILRRQKAATICLSTPALDKPRDKDSFRQSAGSLGHRNKAVDTSCLKIKLHLRAPILQLPLPSCHGNETFSNDEDIDRMPQSRRCRYCS